MSAPLFAPSGDLIADRRFDHARDLAARGDLVAAADLLVQALERVPAFAAAWFALGEIRAKLGDSAGAIAALRTALASDPADRHGAGLYLARLGVTPAEAAMSPAYVRALFDQYAPRFDAALGDLAYRGPPLLHAAVANIRGAAFRCRHMIDLGCGTGLSGAAFRPHVRMMTGVDLSPGMIEMARRKGIYDELIVADIGAWLAGQHAASADLVVAADTFVYLADLVAICRDTARVLAPGGLVAFTVETHTGPGVILGDKLRYAHGTAHVRAAVEGDLDVLAFEMASTRTENGLPVPGLLVVATRDR